MKDTKVFMLEDHTYEGDKALYMHKYYTLESHVADKVIEQGKAISFEGIPELDKYDREIGREVGRFKKAYNKLMESKDPRYKDPEFFADEVAKLKKELDEKVMELQSSYADKVQAMKDEAHRARANLTRNISPSDEKGAQQLVNELVSGVSLGGMSIKDATKRIENDLEYYAEGRKLAIANELHRLADLVDADDNDSKRNLRNLSYKLREDSEGVELATRMADALPDDTGTDYQTLRLTHRAYRQ